MVAASTSKTIKAGSLILDAKNTRIPAERRSDDQRGLLHELLKHEEIKELAASITKLGLFPNERLVVTPQGRRFVVLEGNRRVAAIKLLLTPELAPTEALVRYFRRLSDKADLAALGKLDVVVMADRIAAAPIIAALHTRSSRKRWSSLQQARFYRELIDEGQTVAEVAEEVGVTVGEVKSYLRAEKLYRIAVTLDYEDAVRERVEDSNFALTTLERFLGSKVGRSFLGIELDEDQGFTGVVHPERFKAALARVAADVATKRGLTRMVNNESGFRSYVSRAESELPSTAVQGSFSPDSLLTEEAPKPVIRVPIEPKKKVRRSPVPSLSVVPKGFSCNCSNERVRDIFNELKSISVKDQRNSTGVMLRVLLDISLWSFIKVEGHVDAVLDHYDPDRKKRKHNPDWTPSLRHLISYAVDHRIFPSMTADGYKAVRSLAARDTEYMITVEGFNAFTHNPHVTPTEGDLRALWQRAEPMLEIVLNHLDISLADAN